VTQNLRRAAAGTTVVVVGRQVVGVGRSVAGVGRTVVHVLKVGVLEAEARKPAAGVQEGQQEAGSSHSLMYHPRLCSLPTVCGLC
jgi:hypothetical protein